MKPQIPYDAVAAALAALRTYRTHSLIDHIQTIKYRAERNREDIELHIRRTLNVGEVPSPRDTIANQRYTHHIEVCRARIDKLTAALTRPIDVTRENIESVRAHLSLLITRFYTYTGKIPPWVGKPFYDYPEETRDDITWIVFHTPTIDVGDLAVWRARYAFWLPLITHFRNAVYMRAIHHEIKGNRRCAHPTVERGGWFCLEGFRPHVAKALQQNDLPRAISIILTAITSGAPKGYLLRRCGGRHRDRVRQELDRRERYPEAA